MATGNEGVGYNAQCWQVKYPKVNSNNIPIIIYSLCKGERSTIEYAKYRETSNTVLCVTSNSWN